MTLGDVINNYRLANHLSMDAFADKSGLSKAYISLLEKNKHPKTGKAISPSIQIIKQTASAMNITLNDLFKQLDCNINLSEKDAFVDYVKSLGYDIYIDDPEHKPFIIYDDDRILLEYGTLDELKTKIDDYSNLEIQTELMNLKQKQLEKDKRIKERIIKMQKERLIQKQEEVVAAANTRTDIEITDEAIKCDNDMMNNDKEWE